MYVSLPVSRPRNTADDQLTEGRLHRLGSVCKGALLALRDYSTLQRDYQ
jgi:hypothetical protein